MPEDVNTAAMISFGLAVASWFLCPLLAPVAILKGNESRRLARHHGVDPPVLGTIGLVVGWFYTGGMLLLVGLFVLMAAVGALA